MQPRYDSSLAVVVVTIAAVVTPFGYEGVRRLQKADTAIRHLRREADLMMAFSNEDWSNRYGDDTPMIDIFTGLDRHIAGGIRELMDRAVQLRL